MYSKCRTWFRRHSAALVSLPVSAGLTGYLWKAGYERTASALSLLSVGGTSLHTMLGTQNKIKPKHLVVVTGCDSGLGYSLAMHCREQGAYVVAGMLNPKSQAAKELKTNRVEIEFLDITNQQSINNFATFVNQQMTLHQLEMLALVNNAAVMIFGEFDWQTRDQIHSQVMVNLIGTMNVTQTLMPFIRKDKARIIVISSHCGLESLPGLSIYGATKAGLLAWSTSLRVELAKFGVKVVSFIPGNFTMQSNILTNQGNYFATMKSSMTPENWALYADYFSRYEEHFRLVVSNVTVQRVTDSRIYETFDDALLDKYPSAVYKCEPWRYFFYYGLFKRLPTWLRDRYMNNFMTLPTWKE